MTKKLVLPITALVFLIIGFALGAWITNRNNQRFVIEPARNERAYVAAMHANTLGLLQIGATRDAIESIETMLDTETILLTQKTSDPALLPPPILRALKQVKTYREIYPPEGPDAEMIKTILAKMPKVQNYQSECHAGICRLLEQKNLQNP